MPTNVIEAGRAPNYGSTWSVAGDAINRGLGQVLGYYQEYQKQKKFEAEQAQENKIRAEMMAQQAQQHQWMKEDRQDKTDAMLAKQFEENARVLPVEEAMKIPEFTQDYTEELAGPPGLDPTTGKEIPAGTITKKKLVRTKQFGKSTGIADWGGQQAEAQKKRERIDSGQVVVATPELTASLDKLGLGHYEDVVPATIMGLYRQHMADLQADERLASQERMANARLSAMMNKKSPSDIKAEKDAADNAMLDSIVPGDPSTIPQQYRDMVVAFTEGRGIRPRAGTNVNLLQQMAWKYNPKLNMQVVGEREALRKDVVKGSQSSRGGQITRINQFAGHLDELQSASDEINKHLANSDWQTINSLDQRFTRAGKKGPLRAYEALANTVINEYIATLKGGAPTNEDNRAFAILRDTTTAPAERQAIIDSFKAAIEQRADAQEEVWKSAFGVPSVQDTPMFGGNWNYNHDSAGWKLKMGKESLQGKNSLGVVSVGGRK
jgi:hypothetical protein